MDPKYNVIKGLYCIKDQQHFIVSTMTEISINEQRIKEHYKLTIRVHTNIPRHSNRRYSSSDPVSLSAALSVVCYIWWLWNMLGWKDRSMLGNFRRLLTFFKINFFNKIFHEHCQEVQSVWIQIRTNILSVLIWVQTVYKGNFSCFCCCLLTFFKSTFSKKSFMNIFRVSIGLDPDQD